MITIKARLTEDARTPITTIKETETGEIISFTFEEVKSLIVDLQEIVNDFDSSYEGSFQHL